MDTTFQSSVELSAAIVTSGKIPCLIGPPSTGKTSAAHEVAKMLGMKSFTVPTVTLDVVDVKGLPVKNGDRTEFLPMDRFFAEDSIIILDEFLQARPAVKLSMLDMLDTRQIGGHQLPDSTRFILTGNRMSDDCGVESIPKHLANRFAWVNCRPSVQEWISWAWANDVDPDCIRAVECDRGILGGWEKASEDPDATAYCTPRSMHNLSVVLKSGISKKLVLPLATSLIGGQAASTFMAVKNNRDEIVAPEDALENPELITGMQSISAQHFCVGSLIRYACDNTKVTSKVLDIIQGLPDESRIAAIANVAASAEKLKLRGTSKAADKFRAMLLGDDVQQVLAY